MGWGRAMGAGLVVLRAVVRRDVGGAHADESAEPLADQLLQEVRPDDVDVHGGKAPWRRGH